MRRARAAPPPPERLGPDKVETEALFEPPEWPAADKPTEPLPPSPPERRDDEPKPG